MNETPAATTEQPGPEADADGQTTPGAESAPADQDPVEAKNRSAKDGMSERIDELTSNWRNEERTRQGVERERDYWREEAMRGRQTREEPAANQQRDDAGDQDLKTLADFNYDEKAHAKYVRDLARAEARREAQSVRDELQQGRTQVEREQARSGFQERTEAWAKEQRIDDVGRLFADPRNGGPVVTDSMAEAIMDSEQGPALLNYLTRNRGESEKIARMSPAQQGREIGRLEAKLAAKPHANRVSGAPPPAPRIDGSGPAGSGNVKADSPDSDSLSDAEWAKAREKQLAGRRLAARNRS